jgi:hypothetical protein
MARRKMVCAMLKRRPLACQDWANTKAAYRFLSKGQVKEHTILEGHFQSNKRPSCDDPHADFEPPRILRYGMLP